ncbi:MAG: retropepsin-like aspartic protease [Nonlabens sp.]
MISLKKLLEEQGYIRHNIRMAPKTGHIVTKAYVNGHLGRFIIDTGASASCINQEMYKEFQLETEFMDRQISTASGNLRPRLSLNNTLELGAWSDEGFSFLSMDMTYINNALKSERMKSIQGLLGADFLTSANAVIDYRTKKIFLKL